MLIKILFALMVFASLHSLTSAQKRSLQPDDIYRLEDVEDPQVSPDGKWVAYAVSKVDTAKDTRVTNLYMVSWDGKETVQLTSSKESETTLRWSPDNKYISFLSSREAGKDDKEDKHFEEQLWLMDRRGGEAKKITHIKGNIEDYYWQPGSKKILFVIQDPDYTDTSKDKAQSPYIIDRYHFKQDVQGYLGTRRNHLYLFDIATSTLDTLTSGLYNETSPCFSPDGKQIVFVSNRSAEPDKNDNNDLYIMNAEPNADVKQLTTWSGDDAQPQFSPDGNKIAYIQSTSKELYTMYGQGLLAVIDKNGGSPMLLSASTDRGVVSPKWSKDGKSITVLYEDDRQQNLASFTLDGKYSLLTKGDKVIYNNELNEQNSNWVLGITDAQTPRELFVLENGNTRRLTHVTDSFLAPLNLPTVEGFKSTSKDGNIVSGLLLKPANAGSKRLPLVMFIHGGPVGQDGFEFDITPAVLASAGFAVAEINYRGSSGRGVDYIKAIYSDWGNKEVTDIIGAVDYLINKGVADSSALGIGGWSYGGILTDYTIATDQRFKAACSGAGSALQLSMYGVDQYVSQYEMELGLPWKNPEKWIQVSYPFFHADRIKTPTLFMAGEKDFNVPSSGAEQMYQALRTQGIPTQLIIYPGQHHGIHVPSYQKDKLERYINWYTKYLMKK